MTQASLTNTLRQSAETGALTAAVTPDTYKVVKAVREQARSLGLDPRGLQVGVTRPAHVGRTATVTVTLVATATQVTATTKVLK